MKIITRPSCLTQKFRIYSLIWILLFFMGSEFFIGLQAQAEDVLIYSNRNKGSVKNLPTPTFNLSRPTIITRINTYHWNDGKGTMQPGQIGIKGSGVWQAQGSPGMYNTPNAEWIVYPNVKLGPGTYIITDSDPSTWSQNFESRGLGFVAIYGRSVKDDLYTSKPSFQASGVYSTNWGEMVLKQHTNSIKGRYTEDNGEVIGEITDNIMSGYWIEDSSDRRCSSPKNGRYYWGRIKMVFDPDTGKFSANWGYCADSPSRSDWSGTKKH